jgi:hypothetical protein
MLQAGLILRNSCCLGWCWMWCLPCHQCVITQILFLARSGCPWLLGCSWVWQACRSWSSFVSECSKSHTDNRWVCTWVLIVVFWCFLYGAICDQHLGFKQPDLAVISVSLGL